MTQWKLVGRTPPPNAANLRSPVSQVMVDGVDLSSLEAEHLDELPVVLWDATLAAWRHVLIEEGTVGRRTIRFAVDEAEDGGSAYYVPASHSDADAFDVLTPRYEGHWREEEGIDCELPWPAPALEWSTREDFLAALARVEGQAEAVQYRGFSRCRLCGIRNGSVGYRSVEWEWPEGFRHYLAEHGVRPSPDFESFVLAKAQARLRP